MSVLLNKSDMSSSCGVSVQAFDKWEVKPVERRGREVLFSVRAVLDNRLAHERQKQQPDEDNDGDERRLLLARIRLTEEQATGQQLKNAVAEKKLIDADFCLYALGRLAGELSGILDSIPLAMQRQFPDMPPAQLDHLKFLIAKSANCCAESGENLEELLDDYLRLSDEKP